MPGTGRPRKYTSAAEKAKHDVIAQRERRRRKAATRNCIRFRVYTADLSQNTSPSATPPYPALLHSGLNVLADTAASIGQSYSQSRSESLVPSNAEPEMVSLQSGAMRAEDDETFLFDDGQADTLSIATDHDIVSIRNSLADGRVSIQAGAEDQGGSDEVDEFEEQDTTSDLETALEDAHMDDESRLAHPVADDADTTAASARVIAAPSIAKQFLEKQWTCQCNCTHQSVRSADEDSLLTFAQMANFWQGLKVADCIGSASF